MFLWFCQDFILIIYLLFLYKILNGFILCPAFLSMVNLAVPSRITRHFVPFRANFHGTNYGNNELICRISREANTISDRINFFDNNLQRFTMALRRLVLSFDNVEPA